MSQLMLWSRRCHSQCYGKKYVTVNVTVESMYVTVNVMVKSMSQSMLGSKVCMSQLMLSLIHI